METSKRTFRLLGLEADGNLVKLVVFDEIVGTLALDDFFRGLVERVLSIGERREPPPTEDR